MNKEIKDKLDALYKTAEDLGYCRALVDMKDHIDKQIIKITLSDSNVTARIKKSQDYLEMKQFITNIAKVKHINLN